MWWGVYRDVCKDLWEKAKETSQGTFPIYDHANTSGHHNKFDHFSIVGRESHTIDSTIKEAMFIRVMIHSSTGTLVRTTCPTFEMRSWSTPLISTWNRPSLPGQPPPLHSPLGNAGSLHTVSSTSTTGSYGSWNITNLVPYIMAPGASLHTTNGAQYGKY